jgi:hypothetical protein
MSTRTGLGRHGHREEIVGDPLDGLINLFDIGIVLAVAFLIAGLGLTLNQHTHSLQRRAALPSAAVSVLTSGHGQAVGTVYRLGNGQLVYVQRPR